MDIAGAQQFLSEQKNVVLATWRRDSRLQMSPVTMGLVTARRATISSRETACKVRNVMYRKKWRSIGYPGSSTLNRLSLPKTLVRAW